MHAYYLCQGASSTRCKLHLGYLRSGVLFAAVILIPAIGYRWLRWSPVFAFWFAYVMTRPLGASFADWLGKERGAGGLGWGAGPVSAWLLLAIVAGVAYLTITRRDLQSDVRSVVDLADG